MPIVTGRRPGPGQSKDAASGKRKGRGSTAVYADLREDILSMRLRPGTALDEVALAKRFGLSRTPVREAMVMLSAEQLVTFLPSRSAIVALHTMENTPEYLDALVLHARAVARLAAQERTAEALAAIRERQREYELATAGEVVVPAVVAADVAFHNAVADAGRNQFLNSFYGLTLDYGRRMMLLHYYPRFDGREGERTRAEHAALVAAIANGDRDRAEELATEQIHAAVRVIQRSLEPKLSPSQSLGLGFAAESAHP
jgi:DNA-binding GntR family transcriptional regulator